MVGEGVESAKERPQPVLQDDAVGGVHLEVQVSQGFGWRDSPARLQFDGSQMVAGVGKQRGQFEPSGPEIFQFSFEFAAVEHACTWGFDLVFDEHPVHAAAERIDRGGDVVHVRDLTRLGNTSLSAEQRFALVHICTSRDRVIALRGIAGTGKTTLLRESLQALHEAGQPAYLFAPTSEASRGVLRKEAGTVAGDSPTADAVRSAFQRAETVEKLLTDTSLQTAVAGRVLWIDEAGLLSMPSMRRVFDLAGKLGCRVVLAGDVAQVVEFVRKAGGFAAGERLQVVQASDGSTVVVERADGHRLSLDLRQARAFSVHETTQIRLAAGDKVRVTRNGSALGPESIPPSLLGYSPTRVDNGTLLTVAGFTEAGGVECVGGLVLPGTFGHLASGYCLTSHASQGKTVDHVLLAENSLSAQAAGSLKQGYVSLSRGREDVRVYTDDRRAVEAAWANDGERLSALDLLVRQKQRRRQRSLASSLQWIASRLGHRLRQVFRRGVVRPPDSARQVAMRAVHTTPANQNRTTRKNRPTL